MKNNFLVFSIVILLFTLSIWKTCDILGISLYNAKNNNYNNNNSIKEENNFTIENNNNINTYQTEEFGITMSDGENIFYNSQKYLVKYNTVLRNEIPISTYNVKSLINAGDYIYGVTTLANSNDILCDYVIEISKDGLNNKIYYKTETRYITSLLYNENNIYYTNESHNIYVLDIKNNEVTTLLKTDTKSDYPLFITLYNNSIYYFNGSSIAVHNLLDNMNFVLYDGGCSIEQKPVFYNNYIYLLNNFNQDAIIRINALTGEKEIVIDQSFIKNILKKQKINNFNFIDNYLFINIDGKLYYTNLNNDFDIKEYKNYNMEQNTVNMSSDSIYFINNGKIEFVYLNWLISQ